MTRRSDEVGGQRWEQAAGVVQLYELPPALARQLRLRDPLVFSPYSTYVYRGLLRITNRTLLENKPNDFKCAFRVQANGRSCIVRAYRAPSLPHAVHLHRSRVAVHIAMTHQRGY